MHAIVRPGGAHPARLLERPGSGRASARMATHRIGIDLGGTKIEIVVLGPDGREALRHRIPTPPGLRRHAARDRRTGARRRRRGSA